MVESTTSSRTALPVWLGNGNPNRLVNLCDVVARFDCFHLLTLLYELRAMEWRLAQGDVQDPRTADDMAQWLAETSTERGLPVPENILNALEEMRTIEKATAESVQNLAKKAEAFCKQIGFENPAATARLVWWHVQTNQHPQSLVAELRHITGAITIECGMRVFFQVDPQLSEYFDQEELFGSAVRASFPSSSDDIREAGTCLALGRGTATVFHLMRASEFSLRALARDRDVAFKDKPLDEKEWGQILDALEAKVGTLRSSDRKRWPLPEARDVQIRYYTELVQELRAFNAAWRRHISHADIHAFYDADDALGILKHVRRFMQKMSERISETGVTPEYWISP